MSVVQGVLVPVCWCPRGGGNGGIVPPWLQEPPRIILPVEPPSDDEPVLPVEPPVIGGAS